MLAAGMAAEDIPAVFDALEERYGELHEEDIADLAEYYVASEGIRTTLRATTTTGSSPHA